MGYYPLAINLTGKKCLVVGGGDVALRKVHSLLDAGAHVTVIASDVNSELEAMNNIELIHRAYQSGDSSGYTLVFAATNNRSLNVDINRECEVNGTLINVVDVPDLCSFIVPAVVRRGDLFLAVFSSGKSPALSKRIRKELEKQYGPEYTIFVDLLGKYRDCIKAKYATQSERETTFGRLLDLDILDLIREGKVAEAEKRILQCI